MLENIYLGKSRRNINLYDSCASNIAKKSDVWNIKVHLKSLKVIRKRLFFLTGDEFSILGNKLFISAESFHISIFSPIQIYEKLKSSFISRVFHPERFRHISGFCTVSFIYSGSLMLWWRPSVSHSGSNFSSSFLSYYSKVYIFK